MNKYGSTSQRRLATGSLEIRRVARRAMAISNERKGFTPDFGIAEVLRTSEEQQERFKVGRALHEGEWVIVNQSKVITYCDGVDNPSYHQIGYALDFFAYVDGKYNDEPQNLTLIATCFMQAASEYGYEFEWGGHYTNLSDLCHFHLVLKL